MAVQAWEPRDPWGRGRHPTAGLLEEEEGGESAVTPPSPPALVLYPGLLTAMIVAGRRPPPTLGGSWAPPNLQEGGPKRGLFLKWLVVVQW